MSRPVLRVLAPGLATTVQDLGRPGLGHLGVPPSGAADPWSAVVANRLLGNRDLAATIEMTLVGPDLEILRRTVLAVAGADLGGTIVGGRPRPDGRAGSGDRRLVPGSTAIAEAGDRLVFRGASRRAGARAYLAVPGGIEVPLVLGSRSTCLPGAFGGLDGRALATGDELAAIEPNEPERAADRRARSTDRPMRDAALPAPPGEPAVWPGRARPDRGGPADSWPVRVLPGPAALGGGPSAARLAAFTGGHWTVGPASDRMGLRLGRPDGPAGRAADEAALDAGRLATHGLAWGAIQLPPDGQPIVLLADHQTTGGYPVVAVVISADRPTLGQLAPGDRVGFSVVDLAAARAALERQRAELAEATAALRATAAWDELWQSARG